MGWRLKVGDRMPVTRKEAREENEKEPFPILLKIMVPAIPKKESELQELIEDLRLMGCERLLTKPWKPPIRKHLEEVLV